MDKQIDKKLKQYYMLIHLSQELTSKLDMKTVLSLITKYATELLNGHSAVLLLRDELTQETTYVSVYNVTQSLLQKKLFSSESLGNQIINEGLPIVLNDYANYERRVALLEQYNIKAVMGVPIIWQGKPIGALNVHTTDPEQYFTEDEIDLLFGFANYAAIAIINAKLYGKMNQELKYNNIIDEISKKSCTCTNLQEFIDMVVINIKSLFSETNFIIMVYNSILSTVQYASTCELTIEDLELLRKITEKRLLTKKQSVPNKTSYNLIYGLSSMNAMAIPLVCEKSIKGFLFALGTEPTPEESIVLQHMVTHISLVLADIVFQSEMGSDFRRTVNEISMLHYAIREITEMSLSENLGKQILGLMLNLANSNVGGFFSYNENENSFRPDAFIGITEEDAVRLATLISMAPEKNYLTQITSTENADIGRTFTQILQKDGFEAPYLLPLHFKKFCFGVILLDLKPLNDFDITFVTLRIFSDIASIVIRNAQLYQNERRTVLELQDHGRQLLESETLLKKIFDTNNLLLVQALNNMQIEDIAKTIHMNTGCALVIEDSIGNTLVNFPEPIVYPSVHVLQQNTEIAEPIQLLIDRKGEPILYREGEDTLRYIVPLCAGERELGYMSLFTQKSEWGVFQKHIAESSALAMSLILVNFNRSLEVAQEVRGEILGTLIEGPYLKKKEEILARAKHVGLNANSNYRLLVIEYGTSEIIKVMQKKRTINSLLLATYKMPAKIFYSNTHNGIIVACSVEGSSRKQTETLVNILMKDTNSDQMGLCIGISSVVSTLLDFHRGFQEAQQAVKAGQLYKVRDNPIYFDDMGFAGLLIHEENENLILTYISKYIGSLAKYDKIHNLNLMDTLEAYLDNDCSLIKTAQCLFIHINTLKNRLTRIKQLINIDLHKTEHRVNLFMACKIFRIISMSSQRPQL